MFVLVWGGEVGVVLGDLVVFCLGWVVIRGVVIRNVIGVVGG